MNRDLARRLDKTVQLAAPAGLVCQNWPLYWMLNKGDPDPPEGCLHCGRVRTRRMPVYLIGIDVADI